jgi:hypothetical protein
LLGVLSSYTIGGFLHFLLILALIIVLVRAMEGRKPLA